MDADQRRFSQAHNVPPCNVKNVKKNKKKTQFATKQTISWPLKRLEESRSASDGENHSSRSAFPCQPVR